MTSHPVNQLEVIYCDDIREEASGKRTLVGVYRAALIVPAFPAVLPKFCVMLNYLCSVSDAPEKVHFKLYRDDAVLGEHVVPDGSLRKMPKLADSQAALHCASVVMEFAPFGLLGPCVLRVRAEVDGVELRTSALSIQAKEATAPTQIS